MANITPRPNRAVETMHRMVLQVPKGKAVDHINGDGLDNRKANLRIATLSQNSANRKRLDRQTWSRFKGVRPGSPKKPVASIHQAREAELPPRLL
jgi:hypothetical protein